MKLDVDVLRYLSKDDFKVLTAVETGMRNHEIVPFRTRASHCFSRALEEHGFPVPRAVDCNRHCVIMYLVNGYPLVQVNQLQNPETVLKLSLVL
ncbi:hypothetical protein AB3S75_027224 [Citrus x aurantiifolia]